MLRWTPLFSVGCLQSHHFPTCEVEGETPVSGSDTTPLGTPDEVAAAHTFDADFDAAWADGSPTSAHVKLLPAPDDALWVERVSGERVTWGAPGIGRSYYSIHVPWVQLWGEGDFEAAVLPPGVPDPADYDRKTTFVSVVSEHGTAEGNVGWRGRTEAGEQEESLVLTFGK